jgi:uncharacterized protein (TIRG00374 family)
VNKKKLILTLLKVTSSALLIWWIVQGVDLKETFAIIGSANFLVILVSMIAKYMGYHLSAVRWRVLLRAQGADASILFLISSYMVGFFFNNILPSSIGGDVVRVYDSWRSGTDKPTAVMVVFVDRFLGSLALLMIGVITLFFPSPLREQLPMPWLWIVSILGILAASLWIIFTPSRHLLEWINNLHIPFSKKLNAFLGKIINGFMAFQRAKGAIAKGIWLSVLLQINVVIYHYLIAVSLDLPVPFYSFFFFIPLMTIITMLPISINGIGLRENVFIFSFAMFGVPRAEVLAYSWLLYSILLIQGLLGGVVYALRREGGKKQRNFNLEPQQPDTTPAD